MHHFHYFSFAGSAKKLWLSGLLGVFCLLLSACGDGGAGATGATTTGVITNNNTVNNTITVTVTNTVTVTLTATIPPAWQDANLVETDDTGFAETPRVAIDRNGNMMATWSQSNGTNTHVLASRYNTTTLAWGTPVQLDAGNVAFDAEEPKIAIDPAGNAMVIWRERDAGTINNLWARRYNALLQAWAATPTRIENDVGIVADAQIAMDAAGNATVVWTRDGGKMMASKFSSTGAAWGTATLVATTSTPATQPDVAIDSAGNAIAVWQMAGPTNLIYASRRAASASAWSLPVLIDTSTTGNSSLPRIAMDSAGNAMVVWQKEVTLGVPNIWASRYNAGFWDAAINLTPNISAFNPKVAFDTKMNAVVVWNQANGSAQSIYAKRYTFATSTWETSALLSNNTGNAVVEPELAIDGSDNVMVVWQQTDLEFGKYLDNIYGNRFTAATASWGAAQRVETSNRGDAREPRIAVNTSGKAVAIWTQHDGLLINDDPLRPLTNIYANYFR